MVLLIIITVVSCLGPEKENVKEGGIWPPFEPYLVDYIDVSDIHSLYYELSGNPDGIPVFVLHGGPGGSSKPIMRQFFNPEKYMVVMHDQRGAGKSKPYAELEGNNTWELVEDIEKLRKHLGLKKIMIHGGSWGTTLALAYAETHPERVTSLVLRGLFTSTQEEIDHFYHGGVKLTFPDAYERLVNSLPDPDRRPLPEYLYELLTTGDSSDMYQIAKEWLRYEWRISLVDADVDVIDEYIKTHVPYAFSLIENYYMANLCFLEPDQLWNNRDRMIHIPCGSIACRWGMK